MGERSTRVADLKVRWLISAVAPVLAVLSLPAAGPTAGLATLAAIVVYFLYTLALQLAESRGWARHPSWPLADIALDLGLVSAVVYDRVGLKSDAWALYLLATVSAGFRYGLAAALGVAGCAAALYAGIVWPTIANPAELDRLLIRLVYVALMGVTSAMLAAELRRQKAEKAAAQALADQLQAAKAALRWYAEEKARLAITDGLTGLFNHGYFHQRLGEELARAQRYGHPVSLLMLDLDGFKAYNDALGHPSGNGLLREVGAILRESIRSTDVAARYGGDEFAIVLPQADSEAALATADRIRSATEARVGPRGGDERPVTVSIGVATHPHHGKTRAELIEAADGALYRSKRDGRNRIRCAS